MALIYHPDKPECDNENLQILKEAYERVNDDQKLTKERNVIKIYQM